MLKEGRGGKVIRYKMKGTENELQGDDKSKEVTTLEGDAKYSWYERELLEGNTAPGLRQ